MAALLLPLLETMSAGARIAWPFIQKGVGQGLGANRIQQALRDAGIGIRRQDLLALVREATGAELLRSDLARLPKNLVMPVERVRRAVTKIVAPFSYTVEVTGIEGETGKPFTRLLTAHSDELRPFDEVTADFLEMDISDSVPRDLFIDSARVVDVIQSGTAGVI